MKLSGVAWGVALLFVFVSGPVPAQTKSEVAAAAPDGVLLAAAEISPEAGSPESLGVRPAESAAPYVARVLSEEDAARYAEIFRLQKDGEWSAANRLIEQLDNDILMGHVKYQRYMHPTDYRSSYIELRNWMASYADHPNANRIYRLALRRRPANYKYPEKPEPRQWRETQTSVDHPAFEALGQTYSQRRRVAQIESYVRRQLRRDRVTHSLNYINGARVRRDLADIQYDRLRARIAAAYFFNKLDEKAYAIAHEVAEAHGEILPEAHWTAGLAAWRMGDRRAAGAHFEEAGRSEYLSEWLRSASAFWAARAALANGDAARVRDNLERAAEAPLTFYGQIALKQLGRPFALRDEAPVLTEDMFTELVAQRAGAARAVALVEAEQPALAEEELRRAHGALDPSQDRALFALAHQLNLATSQLEIAEELADGAAYAALYPIPVYQPEDGFEVDRALLYAIMRQESKFIPDATSYAGARGLMQVMPRTASFLTGDRSFHRYRSGREKLLDPALNVALGQDYIQHLMEWDEFGGDLFKLAGAYNGGPGNMRRWLRELEVDDDPLLLIESIPNRQTRNYIEKVLANLWIYRARLGEPTPSLDAVAAGGWPVYEPVTTADALAAGAETAVSPQD
ncbi:MAG: lytic transglycosylase domain-containing protein [Parvularculaceae bacterium]